MFHALFTGLSSGAGLTVKTGFKTGVFQVVEKLLALLKCEIPFCAFTFEEKSLDYIESEFEFSNAGPDISTQAKIELLFRRSLASITIETSRNSHRELSPL